MKPTLLHHLAELARERPTAPAYRQKSRGIWRETTWSVLIERTSAVAAGMLAIGVERGDRVAILMTGRIEAVIAQTAAQLIGALPVQLYAGSPEGVVGAQLARQCARVVFCEDQEQTDKVLAQRVRLPHLAAVVTIDPTGVRAYRQGGIQFFAELEARSGTSAGAAFFAQQLALVDPDEAALVLHTLGTSDRQNPVTLTHRVLLTNAASLQERLALHAGDDYVSLSPLAHAAEQQIAIALPLLSGLRVNFCESQRTALADMREIAPTVFIAPPRVWQALHNQQEQRAHRTGGWRHRLYRRGLAALAEQRSEGGEPGPFWRLLLVRPLLDSLGLTRVRKALVIASTAPTRAARFFAALGVPLAQAYVLSEVGGFVAVGEPASADCGAILRGFEARRSDGDELSLRGPQTADGWLQTGDLVAADPAEALRCLGRKRERVASPGATLHAVELESLLRESPYVRDAVVVASRLSDPVALIAIDFEMVRDWADARALPYTTYRSLATRPEVITLVEEQVTAANARLQGKPEQARIARALVLDEDLDAQHGELTALGTTRRQAVRNHHAHRLLALHRTLGREAIA